MRELEQPHFEPELEGEPDGEQDETQTWFERPGGGPERDPGETRPHRRIDAHLRGLGRYHARAAGALSGGSCREVLVVKGWKRGKLVDWKSVLDNEYKGSDR